MRIMQSYWSSLLRSKRKETIPSRRRWRVWAYGPIAAVFMVLLAVRTFADSATWVGGDPLCGTCWRDDVLDNWIPQTVPNGPADTATFGVSNITNPLILDNSIEVNSIVFTAARGWILGSAVATRATS
jgi:hypothetical protein